CWRIYLFEEVPKILPCKHYEYLATIPLVDIVGITMLLISCCESCERRRASFMYDSKTEDEAEDPEESESSEEEEEKCFECRDSDKEHVHD
ncbi:hypothetical protein TELCIR_23095, partial [Teladorsagia circumcincta]